MELTNTKNVQDRINKMLDDRKKEDEKLNAAISALEKEKEVIEAEKGQCIEKQDFDSFKDCKTRLEYIEDQLSMYRQRKDQLWRDTLVTDEEYAELEKTILEEAAAFKDECSKRILKAGEELIEVYRASREARKLINDTYMRLQRDLYHWKNIEKKYGKIPEDLALMPVEKVGFERLINGSQALVEEGWFEILTGKKFMPRPYDPNGGYFADGKRGIDI